MQLDGKIGVVSQFLKENIQLIPNWSIINAEFWSFEDIGKCIEISPIEIQELRGVKFIFDSSLGFLKANQKRELNEATVVIKDEEGKDTVIIEIFP